MGIILRETADTEETVECSAELVAVNRAYLGKANRKFTVAVRLCGIGHHGARAVHRLYTVRLVIDLGRIHIVLIVIPVTAGLPEAAVHYQRR